MNHRSLHTMARVEILVAMLTLVSVLEIPTHIPTCAAQALIGTFLSCMDRPLFVFTQRQLPEFLTFTTYLRAHCIRMSTFGQTSKPRSVTV
jgi:hypothetical protein